MWVMKNTFYIDKVTRSIEEVVTEKSFETEVLAIGARDLEMCIWEKSARKLVNSYFKGFLN